MPESDSTIQGLPLMSAPTGQSLLVCADSAAAWAPKRLPLETAMAYVLSNNAAFSIESGMLTLCNNLDAAGHKMINLGPGTGSNDAVVYDQIKAAIQALDAITPSAPVITDKGAFLRVAVSTILEPWGGFYLFYWCVDTSPSTTISLVGGSPVASSGATIYFDGSVANIVNLIKDAGWTGKHIHVGVRYRNIASLTAISPTGHLNLTSPGFADMIGNTSPDPVSDLSLTVIENRVYVQATPSETPTPGTLYRLEMIIDGKVDSEVVGNEPNLITITSSSPVYCYEIPLSIGLYDHVHARVVTVSFTRHESTTDTIHYNFSIDASMINNGLMDYLALRLAEKLVTVQDEPLKVK